MIKTLQLVLLCGVALSTANHLPLASANDLKVLNYALTLEHLEATFYVDGLATFSEADFLAAGYTAENYAYIQLISVHETSHVVFLESVINGVSAGAAVGQCTYDFSSAFGDVDSFLTTAAVLENTGQTAYDGAINGITNSDYAQVAAEIATVEARHAAYLNSLTNSSPFPDAFDPTNTPADIAAAITPFLVSCPDSLDLPTIRPSGVALDGSNNVVATGILPAAYTTEQQENDIVALNYALTLENFEAAFYTYALSTFTEQNFIDAGLDYAYVEAIALHEQIHASILTTVINSRSAGAAVPVCAYDFSSVATIELYLSTAQLLENTGVAAYNGAVNTITDTNLQQVAASIATVEGRHAAYLNELNGDVPFPNDFDAGVAPDDIIAAVDATGFIICPYTPVGPVVVAVAAEPTPTPVPGSLLCLGTNVPDSYCDSVCNHVPSFCPSAYCYCETGTRPTSDPDRLLCLGSGVATNDWCDANCNNPGAPYCPSEYCNCAQGVRPTA